MQVLDFLSLVWGRKMGWVDLPSKAAGHWIPWAASWPEDKSLIERRVAGCLEDEEDVYFSVAMFKREGRRLVDTMATSWLWADLDLVDPGVCAELDLAPTVAWESSPFRYQGLWKLDRRLGPKVLAQVNRALSYTLNADKGGWDLTQVLRPVGTRNFKYPGGPEVMLVYEDGPTYRVSDLWRVVRASAPVEHRRLGESDARRSVVGTAERSARIPARARALLATPVERVVVGERSNRLWELNCLLAEAGLAEDEILDLVAGSPWNKWGSKVDRLEADIRKAVDHVARKALGNGSKSPVEAARTQVERVVRAEEIVEDGVEIDLSRPSEDAREADEDRAITLPFVGYSRFMAANLEAPRWLIQDLWMAQSHGVIGGDPKSSKSLLSLAMGLSIASGCPFLGDERFIVSTPGPVLMVQEENTPWDVQDKLRKLARLYGLISRGDVERSAAPEGSVARGVIRLGFPTDAPLLLLNNFGFDMSEGEYREALESAIRDVGAVMVILDPLYLMLGDADADKSSQVRPFQKWLLHLRYTYGCAVVVVHHFGKPRAEWANNGGTRPRSGHRLLGSGTWYNWVDSALYCEARDPNEVLAEDSRQSGRAALPVNRVLRVEREWRSAAPAPALDIQMAIGDPGDLRLVANVGEYNLLGAIRRVVGESGDEGITLVELAEVLGKDKRTVRKFCVSLEDEGKLRMEGGKRGRGHSWRLYSPGVE